MKKMLKDNSFRIAMSLLAIIVGGLIVFITWNAKIFNPTVTDSMVPTVRIIGMVLAVCSFTSIIILAVKVEEYGKEIPRKQ